MEIWKPIKGYEGLYEVSNLGRVKSLTQNNKILKGYYNKSTGGRQINLYANYMYKCYPLHYLVAKTFIENPEHFSIVIHKNGRKLDNRANNLKWVERQPNRTKDGRNPGVRCIELDKKFDSLYDAASFIKNEAELETAILTIKKNIYRACKNTYSAYKYHWEFTQ